MPSFHLSSDFSKAAVKLYIERKLNHAKATLDEHAHLKFVVGRRYQCDWPSTEPMDASVPAAPAQMQECVLVAHLDNEYEVELVADQSRRRVRVKTLTALPVAPVDDCDWSDEAYARDSAQVLAIIAADFPHFQMLHRMPEPQHRTAWPIKFYFPGTLNVRSKMDFDEVDYGIFFAPFVSEAMLPSLTGDQREWLMKTVRSWRSCTLRLLTFLFYRQSRVRRTAASGCTWACCSACIPSQCRLPVAIAVPSSPQKLQISKPAMRLKTANFLASRFAACCAEEAASTAPASTKTTWLMRSSCARAGLQRWTTFA